VSTLHNISTLEEASQALDAIENFRERADWPQHKIHGKRSGGAVRFGDVFVWVWQTSDGWHGEVMPND